MKTTILSVIIAVVTSFTGTTLAVLADCEGVPGACNGWSHNSPKAEEFGYCCVAQTSRVVDCVAPQAKSVKKSTMHLCGQAYELTTQGQCSLTALAIECASQKAEDGCISVFCPE